MSCSPLILTWPDTPCPAKIAAIWEKTNTTAEGEGKKTVEASAPIDYEAMSCTIVLSGLPDRIIRDSVFRKAFLDNNGLRYLSAVVQVGEQLKQLELLVLLENANEANQWRFYFNGCSWTEASNIRITALPVLVALGQASWWQ